MKRIIVVLLILFLPLSLYAGNINTTGDGGLFTATSTWDGGVVPHEDSVFTILAGDTVIIDTSFTIGDSSSDAITINGVLTTDSLGSHTINVEGDIEINNGGEFWCDMSNASDSTFTINMKCASDGQFGIIVDDGGVVDWDGASKTYATALNGAVSAGTDTLIVDANTNWLAGDSLVIEGDAAGETEQIGISSISGDTVFTTKGITNAHADDRKVVNLARNIVFKSDNVSYDTFIDNNTTNQADFNLQYVELHSMSDLGNKRGIDLTEGKSATVQYCAFYDMRRAMYVSGAGGSIDFSYNIFYNMPSATALGNIGGLTSGTFTNNYFFDCNRGITTYASAISDFDDNYFADGDVGYYLRELTVSLDIDNNTSRTMSTGDIYVFNSIYCDIVFNTSTFSSATLISNLSNVCTQAKIRFGNLNSNNDDNRSYEKYGTVRTSGSGLTYTRVRTAGSLSLVMLPNDENNSLEWEFTVACVANDPVVVSGYLWNTDAADTEPTIELSGCGLTADTHTCDSGTNEDSWEQFVVSGTPARNGLATVKVSVYDNSGSTPEYYIDDIIATSTQINLGQLDYWYGGLPASIMLSTGIGANDIWQVLITNSFGNDSMGEWVKKLYWQK